MVNVSVGAYRYRYGLRARFNTVSWLLASLLHDRTASVHQAVLAGSQQLSCLCDCIPVGIDMLCQLYIQCHPKYCTNVVIKSGATNPYSYHYAAGDTALKVSAKLFVVEYGTGASLQHSSAFSAFYDDHHFTAVPFVGVLGECLHGSIHYGL